MKKIIGITLLSLIMLGITFVFSYFPERDFIFALKVWATAWGILIVILFCIYLSVKLIESE